MGNQDGKASTVNRLRQGPRMLVFRVIYTLIDKFSPDPYPYAIDEAFDAYKVLVESGKPLYVKHFLSLIFAVGRLIGMSGQKLNIIISGDSA
jgi:hypothetical protein